MSIAFKAKCILFIFNCFVFFCIGLIDNSDIFRVNLILLVHCPFNKGLKVSDQYMLPI